MDNEKEGCCKVMSAIQLKVKKLHKDAVIPFKAHKSDAGFDLFSTEDINIVPGETLIIKTGIAVQLPPNFEIQIRPRSGVTSKTKLRVQLGTVDEGYRGELGIIIDNISPFAVNDVGVNYIDGSPEKYDCTIYQIRKGDKLAQFVVNELPEVEIVVEEDLNDGDRGENGFGSTGV